MTNNSGTLGRAIEAVKRERQEVQQEVDSFEEFREVVSHTQTANSTNRSSGMDEFQDLYREKVIKSLNYEELSRDSIQESLETEFTQALADAIINGKILTGCRKRNLLIAINQAIDRRTIYSDYLQREVDSLRMVQEGLLNIEETLQELPSYSIQQSQLEKVVDIWETCDELVVQCNQLAEIQQQRFQNHQSIFESTEGPHMLNKYLYADLETNFPALSAITETRRRIERYRDDLKYCVTNNSNRPIADGATD